MKPASSALLKKQKNYNGKIQFSVASAAGLLDKPRIFPCEDRPSTHPIGCGLAVFFARALRGAFEKGALNSHPFFLAAVRCVRQGKGAVRNGARRVEKYYTYPPPRLRKGRRRTCQDADASFLFWITFKMLLFRLMKMPELSVALSAVFLTNVLNASELGAYRVPIDTNDFLLTVPVRLLERDCRFVLDTGASIDMVDQRFKSLLGQPIRQIDGGTLGKMDLYQEEDLRAGQLRALGNMIGVGDLGPVSRHAGRTVDGLLGMQFLHNFVVSIFFDEGHIEIGYSRPRGKFEYSAELWVNDYNHVECEVVLPVGRKRFAIDTGDNTNGEIEHGLFDQLVKEKYLTITSTNRISAVLNGTVISRSGRLSRLQVGPFSHSNLAFMEGAANRLGLGYLRRYNVVLDFGELVMLLRPSRIYLDEDIENRSGLHLVAKDRSVFIESVDKGSPGEDAGLQSGDELVEINRVPVNGSALKQVYLLLANGSKTTNWTIVISRGKDSRATRLELKMSVAAMRESPSKPDLRHIDLSAYANGSLHKGWLPSTPNGTTAQKNLPLPLGIGTFGGVEFNVQGLIQLSGQALKTQRADFPKQVLGIKVSQKCQRLHFLHAAGWANHVEAGVQIGRYVLHYGDGSEREILLINGDTIGDWGVGPIKSFKRAAVVWTGQNAAGMAIQVLKLTWENPLPDQVIENLDYISQMTAASPFLIAIAAE